MAEIDELMFDTPAGDAPGTDELIPEGAKTDPEKKEDKETPEKPVSRFERFMEKLFGGEKEEPEGGKQTDTPAADIPEKTGEPTGEVLFSQAELDAAVAKAMADKEAADRAAAELKKLSPEEQLKAQLAEKDRKIAEMEAVQKEATLRNAAREKLSADGYPTELAELINCKTEDSMVKSTETVTAVFRQALSAAIKARLPHYSPEGIRGKTENGMEKTIADNISGGLS